eukprot:CAMPEP_0198229308 /NCGR_PEP_ID=MMETSP1445-20131203/114053_1 /TAXON_ID=36898 /ORGANISM="Pyramimonas sp., Strain CCMP2087" /LENGTH=328 /DNA_ID=CAMNT_0043909761 /DNA_START=250 /DNA_END=1236 /DNA_ORIENTATION=+
MRRHHINETQHDKPSVSRELVGWAQKWSRDVDQTTADNSEASITTTVQQALSHPRITTLLRQYLLAQQMSEEHVKRVVDQLDDALSSSMSEAREVLQANQVSPELDQFLADYNRELECHRADMWQLNHEVNTFCSFVNSRSSEFAEYLSREEHGGETDCPSGSSKRTRGHGNKEEDEEKGNIGSDFKAITAEEEEEIVSTLKERYTEEALMKLKNEFLMRRKKGKLPKEATRPLQTWWYQHIFWPYPSEEDKRELVLKTSLISTQINNWFINQRKRHWHKLFPDGPPATPDEAQAGLETKYGSMQAAFDAVTVGAPVFFLAEASTPSM